ncbi:MAG TPA: hypothetical protein VN645_11750 [Steroidobacteraceae bacterium]|nr:hypothetical protein [Steroidobacteraceae bacterium]
MTLLPTDAGQAPTLLLMAEYSGTLAAARCVAARGASVTVATSKWFAPSRWSRAARRVVACPDFSRGPTPVAEWLIDYGSRHGKHVLYPTCDEMAWLLAHFHAELRDRFHLYSPSGRTLRILLDKCDLYAAAGAVGIATPRTWRPQDESELPEIMRQVSACLVKPRTQAYFKSGAKGGHAPTLARLISQWRKYRKYGYPAEVTRDIQNVDLPMVQEYLPNASREVSSISGFAVRSGEIIDTRACRKILQLPRRAGVGLCFESCDPDPQLVEQLSRLCSSIGYFGVFEAEFIRHEGRALLIDFNPRYFGQLGFDIARGMQLPWLAQLCATGHEDEARRFAATPSVEHRAEYYADSFALKWHLLAGAWFGAVSQEERRKWLSWLASRPDRFVDAMLHPGDMAPAVAAAANLVWRSARHPRGFWQSIRPERA